MRSASLHTISRIKRAAMTATRVSERALMVGRGCDSAVWARQMAITLAVEHTCFNQAEIAVQFRRERSSVTHAVASVRSALALTDTFSRARACQYLRLSVVIQKQIEAGV